MKIKLFLLFLIFTFSSIFAQDAEVLLQQGNEAYQNKNYDQAIEKYESILDNGFESPSLYYNLGNSYYRIGELGKSVLNYEKALKLDPTDEDARYNLRIVKAHTVDKITEVPRLFFVNWWINIVSAFSVAEWAEIALIIYLLLLVLVGVFFLVRRTNIQRISFYSGSAVFLLLIVSMIFLFARIDRDASSEYGVLLTNMESAKVSPDQNSNDVFVIHEGMKFEIEDELNNWSKIKLPDGKVGWLEKDSFETI